MLEDRVDVDNNNGRLINILAAVKSESDIESVYAEMMRFFALLRSVLPGLMNFLGQY